MGSLALPPRSLVRGRLTERLILIDMRPDISELSRLALTHGCDRIERLFLARISALHASAQEALPVCETPLRADLPIVLLDVFSIHFRALLGFAQWIPQIPA